MDRGSGHRKCEYRKWIQEVDTGSGYRKWIDEVDTGSG